MRLKFLGVVALPGEYQNVLYWRATLLQLTCAQQIFDLSEFPLISFVYFFK